MILKNDWTRERDSIKLLLYKIELKVINKSLHIIYDNVECIGVTLSSCNIDCL